MIAMLAGKSLFMAPLRLNLAYSNAQPLHWLRYFGNNRRKFNTAKTVAFRHRLPSMPAIKPLIATLPRRCLKDDEIVVRDGQAAWLVVCTR